MYCPKCRTEYTPGVTDCADCGAALVPELTPLAQPSYHGFTPILSTFNPADIALIRSMLDGEGIDYFIHGENSSLMQPFAVAGTLMVRDEQAATVREILKDLQLIYTVHLREEQSDR